MQVASFLKNQMQAASGTNLLSFMGAAFVLLSPLAMLLLPKLEPAVVPQWRIAECGPECDGPLLGFVARLLFLGLAHWAIYGRARSATLPQVELARCLLTALAILLTLAFWLFFLFRLFDKRYNDFELQYLTVVQFAISMLESLLFLHYAAVIWLELRPKRKSFCLKVLRSPDGAARYYTCGELSIQRCAQLVLDKYYCQFPSFGPHAEQLLSLEDKLTSTNSAPDANELANNAPLAASKRTSSPAHSNSDLQVWEQPTRTHQQRTDDLESVRSGRSRRSTSRQRHHHQERSSSRAAHSIPKQQDYSVISMPHEEASSSQLQADSLDELERRVRRRRLRLLQSVQETFEQIASASEQQQEIDTEQLIGTYADAYRLQQTKQPLGPSQAARTLYPRIARPLQKYLRLTKQNGRHSLQSIHEHLSKCLLYRLSARAFIEKFTNQDPVWQQSETHLFANCRISDPTLIVVSPNDRNTRLEINSWSLICDTLLSRQINSGTFFVLKQGNVSLLVTVANLPHLNISEEVIDQKSSKFLLKYPLVAPDILTV